MQLRIVQFERLSEVIGPLAGDDGSNDQPEKWSTPMQELVPSAIQDLRAAPSARRYQKREETATCARGRLHARHFMSTHLTCGGLKCKRWERVTPKQFPTSQNPARCVWTLQDWHGLLEMRYECGHCKDEYAKAKEAARNEAPEVLTTLRRSDIDALVHCHIHLYAAQRFYSSNAGLEFPCVMMAQGGVSKELMDLLRPIVNSGTSIQA